MTSSLNPYVLDANVFIEAARRYYAFDIVSSFWQSLIEKAKIDAVLSIDRVKDELDRCKDDLTEWANKNFHSWFFTTDDSGVIISYSQIMNWASNHSQFTDGAKNEFASTDKADAWLVAYALAKRCTVVTHEQIDPMIKRRIPIPNVCQEFGVSWVDTFQMLRNLKVKLG